ncbi:peptidase inhibitor family I36 protein [Nocardia sp. NPDC055165]
MSAELPPNEGEPKAHVHGRASLDAQNRSTQNESYTRQVRSSTNFGVWRRDAEVSSKGTKEKRRTVQLVVAGGFLVAGVVGAALVFMAFQPDASGDAPVKGGAVTSVAQPAAPVDVTTAVVPTAVKPTVSATISARTPTALLTQPCPAGTVCWWDMPDFKDLLHSLPHGEVPSIGPESCLELGVASLGPRGAGSVVNGGSVPQTFWENGDCTGRSFVMKPGEQLAKLPIFPFSVSG